MSDTATSWPEVSEPSEPKFAVEKSGNLHVEAQETLRAFVDGSRVVGYKEAKGAVELVLQKLEHLVRQTQYQACLTHGAINASLEYACPKCFAEACVEVETLKAEIENLKRDLLR